MSEAKQVSVRHEGGLRFVAATSSGFEVAMDSEGGGSGRRPTELVLAALGGCTAMDVASILDKKRQPVERYEVRVSGAQREGHPDTFTEITILHVVEGGVEVDAVRRAIELSATKYCTVSAQLSSGVARLRHTYLIRQPHGNGPDTELQGEVIVTGPLREIGEGAPEAGTSRREHLGDPAAAESTPADAARSTPLAT